MESIGTRLDSRLAAARAWTGHHLRWWIALYHPAVPDDANIYYNLIWAAIYLSFAWSIKMNTTVVRIDCNFLSFSSMKEHFWHKNNTLSVLVLLFNCCSSDQLSCYVCQEDLILQETQAIMKSFVILEKVYHVSWIKSSLEIHSGSLWETDSLRDEDSF